MPHTLFHKLAFALLKPPRWNLNRTHMNITATSTPSSQLFSPHSTATETTSARAPQTLAFSAEDALEASRQLAHFFTEHPDFPFTSGKGLSA